MRLIINADDFGFTKGVNLGILEAFREGVVSSTSMMTNMPGFDHGIELMKKHNELKVGIHLVISAGKPLSDNVKTLLNEKGNFIRDFNVIEERASIEDIRKEYRAQLNKFLATGFVPTHIDFHHSHIGKTYEVGCELAKELGIPMRAMEGYDKYLDKLGIKHANIFSRGFYGEGVSEENITQVIDNLNGLEVAEMMSHPAFVDKDLLELSSYNTQRVYELSILTSKRVKEYIKEKNIKLISFKDI